MPRPKPLDGSEAARGVGPDVHEGEVRLHVLRPAGVLDDADWDAAGSHQAAEVATEVVVAADQESGKLRHDYSTSRMAVGNAPTGAGPWLPARCPSPA